MLMRLRIYARAIVALAAAYALALQAVLLAFGDPVAGAMRVAALPICASLGAGHSAPAGHGNDCLVACLAGCCCGAPVMPVPGAAASYAPQQGETLAAVLATTPILPFGATAAHRSRAPPSV